MDDTPFQAFGLSHGVALAATVLAAWVMVRLNRTYASGEMLRERANRALGVVLVVGVCLDPVCTWLRYQSDPELAARLLRENSLPLHLCDVASLVLAWALFTGNQRAVELGYLWGLSGTLQGLLTPALKFDWYAPEYYGFFSQHGGVPVAALALVTGAGIRPQRGALWRGMRWSWAYMAVVCLLNWLLQTNYGYFNAPPPVASLIDYLGPWPWYLLSLQGVALLFFFLLLLPFRKYNDPRL